MAQQYLCQSRGERILHPHLALSALGEESTTCPWAVPETTPAWLAAPPDDEAALRPATDFASVVAAHHSSTHVIISQCWRRILPGATKLGLCCKSGSYSPKSQSHGRDDTPSALVGADEPPGLLLLRSGALALAPRGVPVRWQFQRWSPVRREVRSASSAGASVGAAALGGSLRYTARPPGAVRRGGSSSGAAGTHQSCFKLAPKDLFSSSARPPPRRGDAAHARSGREVPAGPQGREAGPGSARPSRLQQGLLPAAGKTSASSVLFRRRRRRLGRRRAAAVGALHLLRLARA